MFTSSQFQLAFVQLAQLTWYRDSFFIGRDYHIIAIKSMTIIANARSPSLALLLDAVPGHGAPGGEGPSGSTPRLDHVASSATSDPTEFGSITTDGIKAELTKQMLFPCGRRRGRHAVALLFWAGQLRVRFSGSIIPKQLTNDKNPYNFCN